MPEPFDPYLQWLGIRDPQRPPNHYRLLGVELFESDPEVISNAADRQMAHVRTFQTGRHSAESQKLLNELAAAKVCLLHPEKKAAYDAQLRAERAASAPPPSGAIGPDDIAEAPPRKVAFSGPSRLRLLWVAALGLLAAAALVAVVLTVDFGRGSLFEVAEDSTGGPAGAESPADDAAGRLDAAEGGSSGDAKAAPSQGPPLGAPPDADPVLHSQGQPSSKDEPPKKKFKSPPPRIGSKAGESVPPSSTDADAPVAPREEPVPPVARSIASMRRAMRERNLEAAQRHFSAAEKAGLLQDSDLVVRWADVFKPWEEFWLAVRKGMAACRPGEILRAEGRWLAVVDRGDGFIIARENTRTPVRGSSAYNLRTLPVSLAVTLAEKALPEKTACLAKAAFFLVDPEGDVRQAAAWCDQAKRQGTPPGPGLAAALEEALAAAPSAPGPETASKPRLPVPDKATLEREEARLRETFRVRLAQAKNPADKGTLAGDLLGEAKAAGQEPAARFALLALARDLSLAAGEPARFREATEEMARDYELDLVAERTRALVEASEEKLPAVVRTALAHLAIELALEALQAESFEAAERLAKAGSQYANMPLGVKGRDPNAIRQAAQLVEWIPWYKEQRELALQAEKTLAQQPDDAKAAHIAGAYDALIREQWDRGLPLLLKSDNALLRGLAEAERAAGRSVTAEEMVKLAAQWVAALPSLEAPYQRAARRRALYWYETALPFLSGDARRQASRELDLLRGSEPQRRP